MRVLSYVIFASSILFFSNVSFADGFQKHQWSTQRPALEIDKSPAENIGVADAGAYTLSFVSNGRCLADPMTAGYFAGIDGYGARIQQLTCRGFDLFSPSGYDLHFTLPADGNHQFIRSRSKWFCANAVYNRIVYENCLSEGFANHWQFIAENPGVYRIRNVDSQLCIVPQNKDDVTLGNCDRSDALIEVTLAEPYPLVEIPELIDDGGRN